MDKRMMLLAIGCFGFLLLLSSGCTLPWQEQGNESKNATFAPMSGMKKFGSADELKAFLSGHTVSNYYGGYGYDTMMKGGTGVMPMVAAASAESGGSVVPDYSTTNVQVAGVDEPDFLKSDGKYLYIISGNKLVIVDAYPAENARIVSETEFRGNSSGYYYRQGANMFVNGDELVILSGSGYGSGTEILQYDVSDRSAPILEQNITADGYYFDSRMSGNYVYVVLNKPAYYYCDEWQGKGCEPEPPQVLVSGERVTSGFPDIYYFDEPAYSFTYTTILSIDMSGNGTAPEQKIFLSSASDNMYMSKDNLYLAYERVPEYYLAKSTLAGKAGDMIMPASAPEFQEETGIRRISIANGSVAYAAGGSVPGRVLNQFSMDESNGYFRIATTEGHAARTAGEATARNNVYVLDSGLNITGRLTDLAPGEQIYSARFMGERLYLVTFRKVDPLFVIDLADPSKPEVLGQLKIPGYSDYLHPYDETHLIGLGKDAIPSDEGDFSWYQGIKISLFDVSDVANPTEIANYKIGDRGSDSYALNDHRAFLFDKERNLLVVPVLEAKIDESKYAGGVVEPYAYGDYVFQGAYVFNVSVDGGIGLRGRITHADGNETLAKSGYYYYDSPLDVTRSMYIGDTLYTLSERKLLANDLKDLSQISEVGLPYEEIYSPPYIMY